MLFSGNIFSQNKDTTRSESERIGVAFSRSQADNRTDSSKSYFGILGYPYAFYSPETQLAFGAGGMVYFSTSPREKINLSKITISAYYTTNRQYNFSISPRLFFPGISKVYLEAGIIFSKSLLEFYGLGNNTPETDSSNYISKDFEMYAQISHFGIFNFAQTGMVYEFAKHNMTDKKSNPYLFSPNITGIDGGIIAGLGLAFLIDKRDNNSYPSSGYYTNLSAIFFRKPFGSQFTFDKYKMDLRGYWMPFDTHIFAAQFFSQFSKGNIPFFSLPGIGGSRLMRGYYEGRYRDKNYFAFQAEYRKIFFWRIGAAAFYSIGEVSPNMASFKMKGIRHTYGGGIRFVFDEKERVNLRADIGIAEGKTGIYFSLEEAF